MTEVSQKLVKRLPLSPYTPTQLVKKLLTPNEFPLSLPTTLTLLSRLSNTGHVLLKLRGVSVSKMTITVYIK